MKIRFIAAAAVLVALMASCVKSNESGPTVSAVPEGIPTCVSFNFAVDNTTRADQGLVVAPTNETVAINSLRLLIFKNTPSSTVCEFNKDVNLTTGQMDQSVMITSGIKKIFVVANVPTGSSLETALNNISENGSTLSAFYSTLSKITLGTPGTQVYDISGLTGSPMVYSNMADVSSTYTLQPDITADQAKAGPTNKLSISVKRLIAKGKVLYADNILVGGKVETDNHLGVLTALKYTIRSVRYNTYIFQQFRGGSESTGTDATVLCPDDAITAAQYKSDGVTPVDYSDYKPYFYSLANPTQAANPNGGGFTWPASSNLTNVSADAGAGATPVYFFSENNNSIVRWGNSTFAVIQATYLPKTNGYVSATVYSTVNKNFTSVSLGTSDIATAKDLYVLKVGTTGLDKGAIFADATIAKNAAYSIAFPDKDASDAGYAAWANNAAAWGEYLDYYPGGVCYYQLIFGKGDVSNQTFIPGVLRNNFYKAVISKFANIGASTETGGVDPWVPPFSYTYVYATIDVLGWNQIDSTMPL